MEESVLLGTKPLVDSIRHSIRDPSGVFSGCRAFECHVVQWRHDSRLFYFVEWTECVVASVLFRIMAVASRFVLLNDEQVKEFSESFDKEKKHKKEDLVRFEGFQRISRHLRREERDWGYRACGAARNHQKICSRCSKEKWWRVRTLVNQSVHTKHRPASSKKQLWIFRPQRQRVSWGSRYFKEETKTVKIRGQRKPAKRSGSVVGWRHRHFFQPWSSRNSLS